MSARGAARLALALAVVTGLGLVVTGMGAMPVLLVPVAVAAVPVFAGGARHARTLRIGAAVLLAGWVLLSIASVGLLYLPAALLLAAAAAKREETPARA
jgi:hypothetical protein